jgi:hypothetical protein
MISNQQPWSPLVYGVKLRRSWSYRSKPRLCSDCKGRFMNQSVLAKWLLPSWWEQPHYHSGFYDNVEELSTEEKKWYSKLLALKSIRLNHFTAKKGYVTRWKFHSAYRRCRNLGFTAEGANCHCEQSIRQISMRLVPNQVNTSGCSPNISPAAPTVVTVLVKPHRGQVA